MLFVNSFGLVYNASPTYSLVPLVLTNLIFPSIKLRALAILRFAFLCFYYYKTHKKDIPVFLHKKLPYNSIVVRLFFRLCELRWSKRTRKKFTRANLR